MWLAPNLITTFSFAHAWFAHALMSYYSPTLTEKAPNWAYILVAVAMFLYQTLDAIDGKQARRTKNGSPLGQLFDHGCDAVTAWIMGIFVAATVQAGPTLVSFVFLMMILIPFFAANWEESVTSVMRFGIVGVTEGQFIVMGVELMTGILGPELWSKYLFPDILGMPKVLPWLSLYTVVVGTCMIGGLYQLTSSIVEVRRWYKAHPNEDKSQAIVAFVQFHVVVALTALWVLAPSGAMVAHPRLLLCTIGALCSYQASRLIICHTTGERYPRWFAVMWPLPLVVANEWSGRLLNGADHATWMDSTSVTYGYSLYVVALYVHFVLVIINQITTYLHIRCFHIKPHTPEQPPKGLADPQAVDANHPTIVKKVFGKAA